MTCPKVPGPAARAGQGWKQSSLVKEIGLSAEEFAYLVDLGGRHLRPWLPPRRRLALEM